MINRKCSRCKEITGTLHGGKKLRKNFYVRTVCKRNCKREIELSQVEQEQTSYLSIKILKIMSVIYLIASILMAFQRSIYT